MIERHYWSIVFSGTSWEEFGKAGGNVVGFREAAWRMAERIEKGDYLLCYVRGVSRFIAILETVSTVFNDNTPIWSDEVFPCRIKVRSVVSLSPEIAVPIMEMSDSLSIFQGLRNPNGWTGPVRSSPSPWQESDGKVVLDRLLSANTHPVERPFDLRKWNK